MRAGEMKYKLELLKPVKTINNFGETEAGYEKTATVHAERVTFTGRRSMEVGETFPDYSVNFNIRDAHEVAENWRVRQLGGYLYSITNIIPNLDRGYVTLVCTRVNE